MKMKNLLRTVLMAVCCLGVAAFVSYSKDDDEAGKLKFSVDKLELSPTATFKVTIQNGTQPFTAKSVSEATATVKVDGKVMTITGVKPGKTSIIVSDKNKLSGTLPVKVFLPLIFDKLEVKVAPNKTESFHVRAGKAPFKVTVKDKAIASATVNGDVVTVKGLKAGKTSITVVDSDNTSGQINVFVK